MLFAQRKKTTLHSIWYGKAFDRAPEKRYWNGY